MYKLMMKCLGGASLGTLAMATVLPMTAQAAPHRVTCQAIIPMAQGASLTYRVTGTMPDTTTETPINPVGTTLSMSIQRRDRNGTTKTILNASALSDYEQIAPDADYSRLPFTGSFRGQPNNGRRLYAASASVHGLYASLRPLNGQPQQMQIVHYLSAGRFVRSPPGSCTVSAN